MSVTYLQNSKTSALFELLYITAYLDFTKKAESKANTHPHCAPRLTTDAEKFAFQGYYLDHLQLFPLPA
jgi:hypothetical protein